MKKILIGIALTLTVILLAALIVPSFIDWNRFKADIETEARLATGRELSIGGDISFSVLPTPTLAVADVTLANIAGASETPLLRLKRLDAQISLLPLLTGKIEIARFELEQPEIFLEITSEGQNNWTFVTTTRNNDTPVADTSDNQPATNGSAPDIRLDELNIRNGAVTYANRQTDTQLQVTGIKATLSANSLQGPFTIDASINLNGMALALESSIGSLAGTRATPVTATLDIDSGKGRIDFRGSVADPGPALRVSGAVGASGKDLSALLASLARLPGVESLSAARPPFLAQPYHLEFDMTAASDLVRIRDLIAQLGEASINGSGAVEIGTETNFEILLSANTLDISNWRFADMASNGKATSTGLAREDSATGKPPAATPPTSDSTLLPADISGTVRIAVQAIKFNEDFVRDIALDLQMTKGNANLRNLSLNLPGSSKFRLSGAAVATDGRPSFGGRVSFSSESLRQLLHWSGTDLSAVPEERLRRLNAKAEFNVTSELAQIYALSATLDSSTITGGLAYALRTRPSFGVELKIDRLNADAYLPATATSQTSATPQTSAAGQNPKTASASKTAEASPFAVLDTFDSNFKFSIDALTYHGVVAKALSLNGTLVDGQLQITQAAVGDLAGASANLQADLKALSSNPQGTARLQLDAKNLEGIATLTGLKLPVPAAQLGAAKLTASVGLSPTEGIQSDLDATLGRTRLDAGLTVTQLPLSDPAAAIESAQLTLAAKLENSSLLALSKQFGIPLTPAAGTDAPVSLTADVSGTAARMTGAIAANLARGEARFDGQVNKLLSTPAASGKLTLGAAQLTPFLQGLGMAFDPAARNLGVLSVTADLTADGQRAELTRLSGSVGPVTVQASGKADYAAQRPYFSLELQTSDILADLFLPPAAPAGSAAQPKSAAQPSSGSRTGGAPWSREPLALQSLNAFDADLNLTATALSLDALDFNNPKITLTVRNGVAELKSLTGKLYDGAVTIRGSLRGGAEMPALSGVVDLRDADIEKASQALIGEPLATGKFNLNGNISGRGQSELALISSLEGNAQLAATNGVFRGIDLPALSARLGNLNNASDFLGLVGGAFSGGETGYRQITVPLTIKQGVVRTQNVVMDVDAATGSLDAVIDLPAYQLDANSKFTLSDHTDAPAIGISFKGPLDNPVRNIRTRELEAFFTKKLLGRGLDQLLGKPKTAPADGTGTTTSPVAPQPSTGQPTTPQGPAPLPPKEQILRDVLEGVFGAP